MEPPRPAFFKDNAPWLAAGGLLTFGSSFGQTYFIAIFAGDIRAEFGLSHGAWGSLYALGTLASAALMLGVGGVTDRFRTRSLAVTNLCLFATVCVAMALAPAAAALPVILFGLRFCGQGMMSHLALVSVGRWFRAQRGKAVAVVSMGHGLGEAMLPFLFVLLAGAVGWRGAWLAAAAILMLYVPLFLLILRRERSPRGMPQQEMVAGMQERHWTRRSALGHWLFWACVPGLLAQPVFGTAFFFQQVHLAELKGWSLVAFTGLFPVYTGAGLAAMWVGGLAVDRFGSGRLMPVYLLPLAAGLILVSLGDSIVAAAGTLLLLGATQGLSQAVNGAFWPEYYGTRHLGAIRSVATALMVFATALGPAGTGWLIDAGVDYDVQLRGMAAFTVVVSGVFLLAIRRARSLLPAHG